MKSHHLTRERIVVFTGAGISACSGLTTFKDGLWRNFNINEVATVEALKRDPEKVWDFYRSFRREVDSHRPNKAHQAIAELGSWATSQEIPFTLITQNIDGYHMMVGDPDWTIELHGDIRNVQCPDCGMEYADDAAWLEGGVPACNYCGGKLRPFVKLIGDALNSDDLESAKLAAEQASHVLVVGTSGNIYPASMLIHIAIQSSTLALECNPEPIFRHFDPLDGSYGCYRGRASATVPLAVKEIMNRYRDQHKRWLSKSEKCDKIRSLMTDEDDQMHSLTDLKRLFESSGIQITSFNGMFLTTEHGRWGMALDEYYLNHKKFSRKEIKQLCGGS